MSKVVIPYQRAKELIKNGDVLLFEGKGFLSFLIKKAGYTNYSHAAIVERIADNILCLEFREFRGYSQSDLENYIKVQARINVFRPKATFEKSSLVINNNDIYIKKETMTYDPNKTIAMFRSMSHLPYGYKRIFYMLQRHIPLVRSFIQPDVDDDLEPKYIYPVCSTIVSTCLRKTYVDPVPFLADICVEPGDLSRSVVLDYLFTIGVHNE